MTQSCIIILLGRRTFKYVCYCFRVKRLFIGRNKRVNVIFTTIITKNTFNVELLLGSFINWITFACLWLLAFVFVDFAFKFILLSVSQCILLCFRVHFCVCYGFVFAFSCLLRLMFFVVFGHFRHFSAPSFFVTCHSVCCIIRDICLLACRLVFNISNYFYFSFLSSLIFIHTMT